MRNPFRCFNNSPEVIRLTVMLYIRFCNRAAASVIGPRLSIPHVLLFVATRGSCFCPWSASGVQSRHMMRSDGAGEPI
jgi:hypothetical protein